MFFKVWLTNFKFLHIIALTSGKVPISGVSTWVSEVVLKCVPTLRFIFLSTQKKIFNGQIPEAQKSPEKVKDYMRMLD